MAIEAKICGLRTPEAIETAIAGGAAFIGLVFYAKSPRYLTAEAAGALSRPVAGKVGRVGLIVDASDEEIAAILAACPLDMLQLHGKETPERVAEIRAKFGRPVMKAIAIATAEDIAGLRIYEDVADRLLFDAKPPKDSALPGGNGLGFDWTLLRDHARLAAKKNWMLSGGLDPENVGAAIRLTGAPGVDVSSGVEDAPGEKSAAKILAFIAAARAAA